MNFRSISVAFLASILLVILGAEQSSGAPERKVYSPAEFRASANLYSLVSCARVNGIEPYGYLRYLFEELPKATIAEALEALLP